MQNARERTRTSLVNSAAIIVLARWDFLSYPESYPSQSRAAMGPLGIGWARMSRHRDHPLPASLTHWAGVCPGPAARYCPLLGGLVWRLADVERHLISHVFEIL